jgi:hypothetical protein
MSALCKPRPSRTRSRRTRPGAWWADWAGASCSGLAPPRMRPTAASSRRSKGKPRSAEDGASRSVREPGVPWLSLPSLAWPAHQWLSFRVRATLRACYEHCADNHGRDYANESSASFPEALVPSLVNELSTTTDGSFHGCTPSH